MNIVTVFLKSQSRCLQNQKSVQVFLTVGLLTGVLIYGALFSGLARAGEVWRIQSHLPTGHVVFQNEKDWVDDLNVMLGGRLTLELLPGGLSFPRMKRLMRLGLELSMAILPRQPIFRAEIPPLPSCLTLLAVMKTGRRPLRGANLAAGRP